MTPVEEVYGFLVNRLVKALRSGDDMNQERILTAIFLFEEIWPEDCEAWNVRFDKQGIAQ